MKKIDRIYTVFDKCPATVLPGGLLVVILLLTLLPPQPDSQSVLLFPGADKVVHFIMFGALACAIAWDLLRTARHSSLYILAFSSLLSASIGGGVELLQGFMDCGRSADWFDFCADLAGAVLMPLALWRVILRVACAGGVLLLPHSALRKVPERVRKLYFESFPPEERREWPAVERLLAARRGRMAMYEILLCGRPAGFITWWNMDGFAYVEHFAVDPGCRGGGVGRNAIVSFVAAVGKPVVLEVEPASTGGMARRRIAFYERCGFTAHPGYDYVQPPYGPGLPPVPLMLMTAGGDVSLPDAASALHLHVYGVASSSYSGS